MTDELKSQITALRTAIMRRVEFEQCIHASSIEDEIGKWVREVMEPKWKKWADEPDRMVRAAAYRSVLESLDAAAEQSRQRRAQALAQQKFNQQIAETRLVNGKMCTFVSDSMLQKMCADGDIVHTSFDAWGFIYTHKDGTYYRDAE